MRTARPSQAAVPLDEGSLAALALALGAAAVGGPLSGDEQDLARSAERRPKPRPDLVESFSTSILAGGDPLGDLLATLRPAPQRRPMGQFWTPPSIVSTMLDWALSFDPRYLVDPGCGSGRFSVAAARRRPELEVVAIDNDPLATLLTRAHLAASGVRKARVLNADFLNLDLRLGEGRAAWVGNPPYVRHHDLAPATKRWAAGAAAELGVRVSGLAGLHALFFVATALKVRPGDIGAFVTSAEWLDVGYGAVVRQLFLDGLGGTSLDLIDPRAAPFDDAMTTALISCFEAGRTAPFVAFRSWSGVDDLGRLGDGTATPRRRLLDEHRWSRLMGAAAEADAAPLTLGLVARVHRGFVTGANAFFLLTPEEAETKGLRRWCRPAITDAVEILDSDGVVRSSTDRRVVLDLPSDIDRSAHPRIDAYLSEGEARGFDRRYVPSHRRPWWRLGIGAPPPIVASYMARRPPRFALNPDSMPLVNIGHGIFPRAPLRDDELCRLVRALNEQRSTYVGAGRTYHGGLEKFEPREMEALPLGPWFCAGRHAALP